MCVQNSEQTDKRRTEHAGEGGMAVVCIQKRLLCCYNTQLASGLEGPSRTRRAQSQLLTGGQVPAVERGVFGIQHAADCQ